VQPVIAPPPPAVEPAPASTGREPEPVVEHTAFDAQTYAADAGLLLVETRAPAAQDESVTTETVRLGRPRRERPRPVEEALVQVETQPTPPA